MFHVTVRIFIFHIISSAENTFGACMSWAIFFLPIKISWVSQNKSGTQQIKSLSFGLIQSLEKTKKWAKLQKKTKSDESRV